LGTILAIATHAPQVIGTQGVRVRRVRVTLTARSQGGLALAVLAHIPRETEAVRVGGLGVTVTASLKALALDTVGPLCRAGEEVVRARNRVTVTARGQGGGALTVLAHLGARAETVWVSS